MARPCRIRTGFAVPADARARREHLRSLFRAIGLYRAPPPGRIRPAVSVVVLCGGVGAARFLEGLVRVVETARITAIVNVADDEVFHGLHVSPDLDTVMYTLAGCVDEARGWGVREDTHRAQDMLVRYGRQGWFVLGDSDLATHVLRTERLRAGIPLSTVTRELAQALGVEVTLLPATDDRFATEVRTDAGWLRFQDYFVRRRAADDVREVRWIGAARPAPGVLAAIAGARAVILAPSNPIVSIGPILAVPGIREALRATAAPVVAVSPIIAGEALKGPAAAMLRTLGHECSALGVARIYADLLDALVLDERDAALAPRVAALGIRPVVTATVMRDLAAKEALARAALRAADCA